jgi:hypothetical protein
MEPRIMKRFGKALGWAAACVLFSAQAQAQSPDTATSIYRGEARPVAYHADGCTTGPSCDAAPGCGNAACCDATCGEAGCGCAGGCCEAGCGCSNGCGRCGCGRCCGGLFGGGLFGCCELGDPWTLVKFSKCRQDAGWIAGGWIAQSYTYNPDDPLDGFNGPVTFLDRANEYQMNQLNAFIGKTADTGGCGWAIGGRVDAMYGTDHRWTTATGLETHGEAPVLGSPKWNGENRFYGLALPQFYGEIAYNDISTKIGHFYSPVGYFVVPATGNFFNTMPYTFQYGEPFTHTGFLSTVKLTDRLSVGGGAVRGWDNFDDDAHNDWGAIDTITYTTRGGASLALVHVWTQELINPGINGDTDFRFLQTAVLSKTLNDRLTFVLQSDYGRQQNIGGATDAEWYGANGYAFLKMNDCWSFGANMEWFRDDDGYRVASLLADTQPVGGETRSARLPVLGPAGGFAGNFYQCTVGPKWTPHANVTIRPNARWDWYNGALPNGIRPYDNGTSSNQFIFATDMILTF